MYQDYLVEFLYSAKALKDSKVSLLISSIAIHGKLGVNTFWNDIGAYYLSHPSEYVTPPSINDVRQWFFMIGYGEEIFTKWTLKKSLPPPRWRLLMDEHVPLKAPKSYSQTKMKVSKGKKPGALAGSSGILTRSKLKESKVGASKKPAGSQKAHSEKRKESSQAMDSNPSQPLASTLMVADLHKEVQQVASGPTSLRVTSEEGANPQLSSAMLAFNKSMSIYLASFIIHYESASGNDDSADSTAEANPETSAPNDSLPP
nr:hypothetical protein [Tanacetum cinerariifolium]